MSIGKKLDINCSEEKRFQKERFRHLCVNVFVRHIEFLLMHRSPKKKFILIMSLVQEEGVGW